MKPSTPSSPANRQTFGQPVANRRMIFHHATEGGNMKPDRIEQQTPRLVNPPLISIGLPTYNGAQRLGSAIAAILNQNYPNLEVIISDNCSSDNTETVCAEFCKHSQAIHYFRQKENIGIISNFEFVLRQAQGDFFMWVADDDSLELGILQKYIDFLTSNRGYALVSGKVRYWSDQTAVFDEHNFSFEHSSPYVRVIQFYAKVKYGAIFHGLMPIDVAKKISLKNRMGEDWHLVAKIAFQGKIKMLDNVGYHKKLNGSSKTLKRYAGIIGAGWFTANFPHIQIAIDAFLEVMVFPLYKKPLLVRLTLALASLASILFNYYGTVYPFILGGRVARFFGFETIKDRIKGKNVTTLYKKGSVLIAAINVLSELWS